MGKSLHMADCFLRQLTASKSEKEKVQLDGYINQWYVIYYFKAHSISVGNHNRPDRPSSLPLKVVQLPTCPTSNCNKFSSIEVIKETHSWYQKMIEEYCYKFYQYKNLFEAYVLTTLIIKVFCCSFSQIRGIGVLKERVFIFQWQIAFYTS